MLKVTIELVPYGEESIKRVIETMVVYNDSVFPDEEGNYKYVYTINNVEPFIKDGKRNLEVTSKKGEVWNHDRKKNVWCLIKRILNEIKED